MQDNKISILIESQFPSFYHDEGQGFIDFVQAYYEWMELENNVGFYQENFLKHRDIDKTIDVFIEHFKQKYLINIPFSTKVDRQTFIKHSSDLYKSKGSDRSFKLLFRLLFDDEIEIYYPGNDILRVSDGDWFVPQYLEVSQSERTKEFIGKEISGTVSGAKAFVESISRKFFNNKIIDIVYISNIRGNFKTGELISDDNMVVDAPIVIGSLNEIIISNGGANNIIGEVFTITSASGKQGKAKVTAIENATGRVVFTIIDGGTGYDKNYSTVIVSNTIIYTSNLYNVNSEITNFKRFETIVQPLANVSYIAANGSFSVGDIIVGRYANGNICANGVSVASANSSPANGHVIINITSGDYALGSLITNASNSVGASILASAIISATGNVTGFNANSVGLHNLVHQFYANATLIGQNTNTTALATSFSTGSGANFKIGSVENEETLTLYTDFIDRNIANVLYTDIGVDGSNSGIGFINDIQVISIGSGYSNSSVVTITGGNPNVNATANVTTFPNGSINYLTVINSGNGYFSSANISVSNGTGAVLTANMHFGYGFPKDPFANLNTIIDNSLYSNNFTIGTISSLTAINPGSNYNADPFVVVINKYIAGYNRKDLIINTTTPTNSFKVGEPIQQQISVNGYSLGISAQTGSFSLGEGIVQANSSGLGFISTANSSVLTIKTLSGTFITGKRVTGQSSNASANVISNTVTSSLSFAKGIVKQYSNNIIYLKRTTFGTSFEPDIGIAGQISGAVANVVSIMIDENSSPFGDNAIIEGMVRTANGVATEVKLIDTGFGYVDGEEVVLTSSNNVFSITGSAKLIRQGYNEGFFKNTKGFLNSDKYIHDNKYYQEYSYEIQSKLTLDRYAKILKDIVHVAGTQLFGSVVLNSSIDIPLNIPDSEVEIAS